MKIAIFFLLAALSGCFGNGPASPPNCQLKIDKNVAFRLSAAVFRLIMQYDETKKSNLCEAGCFFKSMILVLKMVAGATECSYAVIARIVVRYLSVTEEMKALVLTALLEENVQVLVDIKLTTYAMLKAAWGTLDHILGMHGHNLLSFVESYFFSMAGVLNIRICGNIIYFLRHELHLKLAIQMQYAAGVPYLLLGATHILVGGLLGGANTVTATVGSVVTNVTGTVTNVTSTAAGAVGSIAGNVTDTVTNLTSTAAGAVGSIAGNVTSTVTNLTSTANGIVPPLTSAVTNLTDTAAAAVTQLTDAVTNPAASSGPVGTLTNAAAPAGAPALLGGVGR